jgi:cob(I)alamin adenosyltransferase
MSNKKFTKEELDKIEEEIKTVRLDINKFEEITPKKFLKIYPLQDLRMRIRRIERHFVSLRSTAV